MKHSKIMYSKFEDCVLVIYWLKCGTSGSNHLDTKKVCSCKCYKSIKLCAFFQECCTQHTAYVLFSQESVFLPSSLSGSTSCAGAGECRTGRAMDIGDDNFTRSCTRDSLN